MEMVNGRRKIYNTVFAADEDGVVRSTYDKTYLLMFGEYLPFGDMFPSLYELSPNSSRFTAGSHVHPVTLGPWRISTPVCYEDVLARFTRRMVREGKPHILINLTNDAWFGDSSGPYQHLASAQLRAVEQGIPLVRDANTGISAVVDSYGRIVAELGLNAGGTVDSKLPRPVTGRTIYARFGNATAALLLLVACMFAWYLDRRHHRG